MTNNTKDFEKLLCCSDFREEQRKLEMRIKQRPLPRPKTKLVTVLFWIILYLLTCFIFTFAISFVIKGYNFKWLIYSISYTVIGLLFLKKICIKAIECYQHYAKDETRRRCVCIPSCSEYSIAVLKKYNIFKALHRIRIRLFRTCGGYGYVQDDP